MKEVVGHMNWYIPCQTTNLNIHLYDVYKNLLFPNYISLKHSRYSRAYTKKLFHETNISSNS